MQAYRQVDALVRLVRDRAEGHLETDPDRDLNWTWMRPTRGLRDAMAT